MFKRILVPLDGSELAEKALPLAQSIAQSSNAAIRLVQVVSRLPELEAGRTGGSIQVAQLERDAARQLVEGRITRGKEYVGHVAAQLEKAGIEVLVYDGTEISRKGEGGPTCLTRPLAREQ